MPHPQLDAESERHLDRVLDSFSTYNSDALERAVASALMLNKDILEARNRVVNQRSVLMHLPY